MEDATVSTRLSLLEACTRNHAKYSIGERHIACLTLIDLIESYHDPLRGASSHMGTHLQRAEGALAGIDLEMGDCVASSSNAPRVQDLSHHRDISPFLEPGPDFLTCAELSELLPAANILRTSICTPSAPARTTRSAPVHALAEAPLLSATSSPVVAPAPP